MGCSTTGIDTLPHDVFNRRFGVHPGMHLRDHCVGEFVRGCCAADIARGVLLGSVNAVKGRLDVICRLALA